MPKDINVKIDSGLISKEQVRELIRYCDEMSKTPKNTIKNKTKRNIPAFEIVAVCFFISVICNFAQAT